jgi:predicted ATPase
MKTLRKAPSGFQFLHLRLENWRNFARADVDLAGRVFLVGPNASGKSNFLDAFRFLRDIVLSGGLQHAVAGVRNGVSGLRCLAARRYSDIEIAVQVGNPEKGDPWEYAIRFNQDNRQRPVLKEERVLKGREVILHRPNPDDLGDPERLTQTFLEQVNVNRSFREIADFFSSVRYLHIVPQLIRDTERSVGRQNDPFGGDLLEQLVRTPKKTQDAWFRRIKDALKVSLPQLKELKLERDSMGSPHLRGLFEHWRPKAGWQTEEQFSDGTLRLFGLLWAILDGTGPLLLEEPEMSLHTEIVSLIPQMIARMQSRTGRQLLVSTHSSDLLKDSGIGLHEVLLFRPDKEGTVVHPASHFEDIKRLLDENFTMAEAIIPMTRPRQVEQLALFGE